MAAKATAKVLHQAGKSSGALAGERGIKGLQGILRSFTRHLQTSACDESNAARLQSPAPATSRGQRPFSSESCTWRGSSVLEGDEGRQSSRETGGIGIGRGARAAASCFSTSSAAGNGAGRAREALARELLCHSLASPHGDDALLLLEHGVSQVRGADGELNEPAARLALRLAALLVDRLDFEKAELLAAEVAACGSLSAGTRGSAARGLWELSLRIRNGAPDASASPSDDTDPEPAQTDASARPPAAEGAASPSGLDPDGGSAEAPEGRDMAPGEGRSLRRAVATLSSAGRAHCRGRLQSARGAYARALEMAEAVAPDDIAGEAAMVLPEEVELGALAGLGQLATHTEDFGEAEEMLTAALKKAEALSGGTHPRVGAVLACLAHVYSCRARAENTTEGMVAEGLYRRALQIMERPATRSRRKPKELRGADAIEALTKAQYANVLAWSKNREGEANRLMAAARAAWPGKGSLESVVESSFPPKRRAAGAQHPGGASFAVMDVRLGCLLS